MLEPLPDGPLAFSYVRMSTDIQLKGDSKRRQLELSDRYAEQHGLRLVTDNRLEDIGVSAFKGANLGSGTALGAFLSAVRGGKIAHGTYLLVESLDRLSRQDVLTSLSLFIELIKAGIVIVTLVDGQIYAADRTDFTQLIVSLTIMSRAHEESQTKSRRLSEAWVGKRRRLTATKLTAMCPAWLRLSADKQLFEVDEPRAATVRAIFEDSAAGIGSFSIARLLNERGVLPFGRSVGWQVSYVKKILANRAVLGEFRPHRLSGGKRVPEGTAIPDYFPRIVDEALFNRAQASRSGRQIGSGGRRGIGLSNLFSGLATCAYCGGGMHFVNKGAGPKGGQYLTCDRARRGMDCIKTGWRYADFEASFLAFVAEADIEPLTRSDQEAKRHDAVNQSILADQTRLKLLESQRARTFRLLVEDEIAPDYLKQELARFDHEIAATTASLQALEQERQRLLAEVVRFTESRERIKDLVGSLRADQGGGTFRLRAQIASRLKSLVGSLKIGTVGQAPLINQSLALVVEEGENDGFSASVKAALEEDAASAAASRRFFSATFKDGRLRVVQPDADDPFAADGQVYKSPAGFVSVSRDGAEDLFLPVSGKNSVESALSG